MWLVEKYGVVKYKEKIREEVTSYDRGVVVEDANISAIVI